MFIRLSLFTFVGPGILPLRLTPWVSKSKELNHLSIFVKSILEFNDVIQTVGVIENESTWYTIDHQLSFLAVSFDTAAHQTVVVISILEEVPESF